MTLFFNISLVLFLVLVLLFLAKINIKVLFLFGLLVFQALAIIPSLVFIEEGIFISEQGRESFFSYATLIYVVYFTITLITIFITFGVLNKVKTSPVRFKFNGNSADNKLLLLVVLFSLGLLILNAVQSQLPLIDSSVSRFTYWENSKYPFLNKVFGNVSIFIPFALGILFRKYKFWSVVLMIVYFVYNFFIGQKFSPIISGLFSFALPIVLLSDRKLNFNKIFNKKVILVCVLLFSLAYGIIYKRYEQNQPYATVKIYDPNEAMFYRIFGLQGHLMWGATEKYVFDGGKLSYDFTDMSYGMHKLMFTFAVNQKGLQDSLNQGFSFTNGYPSALLTVYPLFLALIIHVLLTIFCLGLMGWILKELILSHSYFLSVIAYQVFNWTIYAFTMGYFYKLKFTVVFILFYIAVNILLKYSKRDVYRV